MPEKGQQVLVRDPFGVEIDLNGLGMIPDISVIRILSLPATVADTGSNDAFQYPELGFDSPKSPQPERSRLEFFRRCRIDGGNRR